MLREFLLVGGQYDLDAVLIAHYFLQRGLCCFPNLSKKSTMATATSSNDAFLQVSGGS